MQRRPCKFIRYQGCQIATVRLLFEGLSRVKRARLNRRFVFLRWASFELWEVFAQKPGFLSNCCSYKAGDTLPFHLPNYCFVAAVKKQEGCSFGSSAMTVTSVEEKYSAVMLVDVVCSGGDLRRLSLPSSVHLKHTGAIWEQGSQLSVYPGSSVGISLTYGVVGKTRVQFPAN